MFFSVAFAIVFCYVSVEFPSWHVINYSLEAPGRQDVLSWPFRNHSRFSSLCYLAFDCSEIYTIYAKSKKQQHCLLNIFPYAYFLLHNPFWGKFLLLRFFLNHQFLQFSSYKNKTLHVNLSICLCLKKCLNF